MKTVNLLPGWYLRQRRKQHFFRIHVLLMLVLGAGLSGTAFMSRQRLFALRATRDGLAARLASLPSLDPELQRRQAELKRLQELLLARRELGSTIPMSAVMQQLQNELTPGMALSNVIIDVRPEPVKGSGMVGDSRNPPRYRDVAHLTVVGISPPPSDGTMQFYNNIVKNPLFSAVMLSYTRSGVLLGYAIRKFEIQLDMDLDKLSSESADPAAPASDGIASPLSGGSFNGQ